MFQINVVCKEFGHFFPSSAKEALPGRRDGGQGKGGGVAL